MKSSITKITERVESKCRPQLEEASIRLANQFPAIRTRVSSFLNRAGTTHVLSLECVFPDADESEPDLLALCITTERTNSITSIDADVSWGAPSGYVEISAFEHPQEASSEAIEAIHSGLPSFFDLLERLIIQGKPTNAAAS